MTKTGIVALAAAALACGLWTTAASAKHHAKHHPAATQAPAQAEEIQGANPMTNAKPIPAVANKKPFEKVPGVNPM